MISDGKFASIAVSVFVLLILVNAGQLGQAQVADSPWPKFMHDTKNTGRSPYIGPQDNTLKWEFPLNGWLGSAPAIGVDGTIYFGTFNDNKFYALNPDGTLKWFYQVGWKYWTYATPAISADGTIYFYSSSKRKQTLCNT